MYIKNNRQNFEVTVKKVSERISEVYLSALDNSYSVHNERQKYNYALTEAFKKMHDAGLLKNKRSVEVTPVYESTHIGTIKENNRLLFY